VRELRADGVAVVLTTHLMDEAEDLADRVHVVDHGRVIASGTVPELLSGGPGGDATIHLETVAHLDLAELISALPVSPGGSADSRALAWTAGEPEPGSYVLTGPADPQAVAALTAWLAGTGALARRLTVGRRTLEDVFLDLTGRHLR
jgi:ABC-2 type transport system ATP-binding protein